MKKKIVLIIFLILIILGIAFLIRNDNIKEINNSLVYIESMNDEEIISGSGFVYKIKNNKNYILTNYHVIHDNKEIYVYNENQKKERADVIYIDKLNDIAIISIEDNLSLKSAKIGDSDKLRVNDTVYAIGTPENIKNFGTVTKGKILSLDALSDIFDFSSIEISIQTTYGNSGGPLINTNGEVVGMLFLKDEYNDISYAIPINYILEH